MPVGVELSRPEWLLALPVAAAFLVFARWPWWRAARARRHVSRGSWHAEVRRMVIRLVWIMLPVLALAGAGLTRPMDRLAIVFVVDHSASVASVRDQEEAFLREALEALRDGDLAGVVVVGEGARVEARLSAAPLFTSLSTQSAAASDLATGLALAGGLVPPDRTGRIVLLSDGRETSGDAAGAARDLAARGIRVDVVPMGPEAVADLRLDRVDLPETARAGEASVLRTTVSAGASTAGQLRVYRDDELVVEQPVELRVGEQDFALSLPPASPGTHRVRVEVVAADPAADGSALNNTLGAVQRVLGAARVLVVAGESGAGFLPAALEASGAQVEVVAAAGLPAELGGMASYDAIVLADLPAASLPVGSGELLERYVRELGRGLVMTGGRDAFGPGGYAGTPVEDVLPVYMDVQGRGREPRVAMMLVIDRSGSMQGLKMEMAKEAAVRAVRQLRPQDQVGVLVFDSVPQWVSPLVEVGDGEALEDAIGRVFAGGGTEIFPAVLGGFEALREVEADVKHMIVLTDGHSGSGGDYVALLEDLRAERMTLSSIAVGSDADTALMEALARGGRGRSHVAVDPASLPEIFTEETVMATRSILVDGPFFPTAASASPILEGLGQVAQLDGYVAVTPKERAEVVLLAPEGDPVLAAWQYGAGRALAWTPDLGARWAPAWSATDAATRLWGNALSWLLPPPDAGELVARVESEAGGYALVVENQSAWDEVRPTSAAVVGGEDARFTLELQPAGPGRYRAYLPALETGAYVIQVSQDIAAGEALRTETGWAAPYPAEYAAVGVDLTTLSRINDAGSGRQLEDPGAAVRPPEQPTIARWSLVPWLLVLAAIAWPLEVASRRLPPPSIPASLQGRLPAFRRAESDPGATLPSTSTPVPDASASPPGGLPPGPPSTARLLERTRNLRERRR